MVPCWGVHENLTSVNWNVWNLLDNMAINLNIKWYQRRNHQVNYLLIHLLFATFSEKNKFTLIFTHIANAVFIFFFYVWHMLTTTHHLNLQMFKNILMYVNWKSLTFFLSKCACYICCNEFVFPLYQRSYLKIRHT